MHSWCCVHVAVDHSEALGPSQQLSAQQVNHDAHTVRTDGTCMRLYTNEVTHHR